MPTEEGTGKSKISWAEDESSDEEETQNEEQEHAGDSDSDSSDDDGEVVVEKTAPSVSAIVGKSVKEKSKKNQQQLSKKEKAALKAQELDDLDTMLAGFGVDVTATPSTTVEDTAACTIIASADGGEAGGDVSKKNKKKNKKKKKGTGDEKEAPPEQVGVFNVKSILAGRNKKSGGSGKSVALSEALKELEAGGIKKKGKGSGKKDKAHYNEMPY